MQQIRVQRTSLNHNRNSRYESRNEKLIKNLKKKRKVTDKLMFAPTAYTLYYEGWSKNSRPELVLFKIKFKIVLACHSNKAQNTTCAVWLLGYKYFVHFSVWTQCLSEGVENVNTSTVHKFLKNFSNDTDVTQQKFISQLVIQDETWINHFDYESEQQNMQWNEWIGKNCHFITLRNSVFPCRMQTTDDC